MTKIMLLIFLVFATSSALAQDYGKKYFYTGDDIIHIERTTFAQDPYLWNALLMPRQCQPVAHSISARLVDYDKAIKIRDTQTAKEDFNWITTNLRAQTTCFQSLAAFYALHYGVLDIGFELDLFIQLYRRGKLKAMNGAIAVHFSAGADEHKDKILGAYDCEKTTIYFDPFRGPNDLSNILRHERDHFIRDKFIHNLSNLGQKLTPTEYAIADETLATLTGALGELNESDDRNLAFDLSLFSDRGKLVKSIREYNRSQGELLLRPSYYLYAYMNKVGFSSDSNGALQKIIDLVASVYAPHSAYRINSIMNWLREYDFNDANFWTANNQMISGFAANTEYKTFNNLVAHPSATCLAFAKQVRMGELKDYLGSQVTLSGARPVRSGKPVVGSEGTKPILKSLRPCIAPPNGF